MSSRAVRTVLLAALAVIAGLCPAPAARPGEGEGEGDAPLWGDPAARDPQIPTWQQTLGFEPGERPVRHDEIRRYLEALAAASPRARLEEYGRTHEGRALVHLIVTSEKNASRLDAIRDAIERIGDPRRAITAEQVQALIEQTPAVAWLGYSIHGDEVSSSDAALLVAHQLVSGGDDATKKLLDELVVIIDPLQNPDGRERVLSMLAAFRGRVMNPDPDALNHTGFWPYGRTNHYLFDLNRDWFSLVHPESEARARVFARWRPQLIVDSHEMGSDDTYLFNPPRAPYNPFLPTTTLDEWKRFGRDQARAFDRRGWSYYTGEWNEEFFPGYGSSIAMYRGALGILYEQASTAGQDVRLPSGRVRTYRDSVDHHYVSSLTNLQTLAADRPRALRNFREARRGVPGHVAAYLIEPGEDPGRTRRLVQTLLTLGVEVEVAPERTEVGERFCVQSGAKLVPEVPVGTCRVRTDQPLGRLVRVVLDPHIQMPEAFVAEERWYQERRKGTRLYEATAWSPLLAYDVAASWTPAIGDDDDAFEPLSDVSWPTYPVAGEPGYGYLVEGGTEQSARALVDMLERGLRVRCGLERVEVGGAAFDAGVLLVRNDDNGPGLAEAMAEVAAAHSVRVVAVPTALATEGPDLGGGRFELLQAPRVAIVAGGTTSSNVVGAAWHALDQEVGLRTSLLDVQSLGGRADLSRYNVIVLPPAAYERLLDEDAVGRLRAWVEAGGTLIGIAGGAHFCAAEKSDLSKVRLRSEVLEKFPAPRFGLGKSDVESIERLVATGLGADGKASRPAGRYTEQRWPDALRIPGIGEPLLGPGARPFAGAAGERAAARGDAWRRGGAESGSDGEGEGKKEDEKARKEADDRMQRLNPRGAILAVDLDPEEWIAFGAGQSVPAMVRGSRTLIAQEPVRTVGRYAAPEELHLGGLLWPEAAGRWALTGFVTRESRGRGQIILFAEDPNFRGYFRGTKHLFVNAVTLGPGMGTRRAVPWRSRGAGGE